MRAEKREEQTSILIHRHADIKRVKEQESENLSVIIPASKWITFRLLNYFTSISSPTDLFSLFPHFLLAHWRSWHSLRFFGPLNQEQVLLPLISFFPSMLLLSLQTTFIHFPTFSLIFGGFPYTTHSSLGALLSLSSHREEEQNQQSLKVWKRKFSKCRLESFFPFKSTILALLGRWNESREKRWKKRNGMRWKWSEKKAWSLECMKES